MARKKEEQVSAEPNSQPRRRVQSDFPKNTLEDALRVARALEDANGGQPLPPIETATALGMSPGSSDFRKILSSSLKYGLTKGSYKSAYVELDELGREVVEPKVQEDKHRALELAAMRPQTFQHIYDYYKGKKLPEDTFFRNTIVREFNVPREHAEQCEKIFTANADFVGLVRTAKTGRWLSTEATPPLPEPSTDKEEAEESTHDGQQVDSQEDGTSGSLQNPPAKPKVSLSGTASSTARRVFITHGKNKSFVEPVKKLLGFGELVPVVSVERQTVSKPVPEKVMDDMRSSGAAIIHVEAEQVLIDKDANEQSIINPNVLIEIGAAMALFGKRFILLVRDGVNLPSNLSGLYEVRYNGDALDGDATIRLLEAINDIKNYPLPERYRDSGNDD